MERQIKDMKQEIKIYLKELQKIKDETEHSGRTALENLLKNWTEKQISIIHEPSRDDKGKGSPDFKFESQGTIIGYLETKKIGEDLDKVLKSKQIQKYKTLTENLIVTDYLRWIWICEGKVIKDIRLGEKTILEKKISIDDKNCKNWMDLIKDFLSQQPQLITKSNELAKLLAPPTRTIKEEIEKNIQGKIQGLFEVFQKTISKELTKSEFADAFSQTMTYSLFLTKLNLDDQNKQLQLNNITTYLPKSFSLMKDILIFIHVLEEYPTIKPYIERILNIINHIETDELLKNLRWSKNEIKDAYLYFYEDFLKEYDKSLRVQSGVYYTPRPVVQSIIQNIDNILKTTFDLQEGLANKQVKLLDFATGTGTFLIEIYDLILKSLNPNSLQRKQLIQTHILKNLYGFELLIPAYCISHLKCSQYLKEQGNYTLNEEEKERIPIYFTNTLEKITVSEKNEKEEDLFKNFFPQIIKESQEAKEIKENQEILVITGNPPYNGTSKNNFPSIQELIQPYFPKDDIKEKNPKWLNDDYVKFIRFAEDKIVQSGKGIVGIITNHSFLDNPTFRAMRKHLMESFEQIYLIDLHGNVKKKEKSPDGSTDQNVFDIQQGVSISFFIKNKNLKEKGVYHLDLFGKREEKFQELQEIDIKTTKFQKLNPIEPFYLFIPQDETVRAKYEIGISLRDIFNQTTVGIVTGRDNICIDFSKKELDKKINNFLKLDEKEIFYKYNTKNVRDWTVKGAKEDIEKFNQEKILEINYRPFDKRWTYYTGNSRGFMQYPRYDIMKHFIHRKNIGLVFVRRIKTGNNLTVFISENIQDDALGGMSSSSIAPLYLYQENLGKMEKIPNFQPSFYKFIQEKFSYPTPEQILAYIYGVLHSPTYRNKYLDFLKIDFPRIPFDCTYETFQKISTIGQELIDAHLMKTIPNLSIGDSLSEHKEKENFIMEKVDYKPSKKRLYFNQTSYFDKVSEEVFQFKIGGYQVLDKYLKSRKGLDILEDLEHIEKVIKVCTFTIETMKELDRVGVV